MRKTRSITSLDMGKYNWSKLSRSDVQRLSDDIFHEDMHIMHKLRRGLWMHLLHIFHPSQAKEENRKEYIAKLRRVYDSLKGKMIGNSSPQVRSLCESVRRDALRTDPTEEFYSMQSRNNNVEKLINITVVYTLEHKGVSYTQGMTDLLSPLLYVMEREDDAYICFAAMLERLEGNFTSWCDGALKKVERLRHLCEVLDPELYHYLVQNVQEDVFALFFGMILIDCRREFSFQDSLHLYEVLMASIGVEATADDISEWAWAKFLTTESLDIIKLVFGEEAGTYSAQPLGRTDSSEQLVTEVHIPSEASPPHGQCGSALKHPVPVLIPTTALPTTETHHSSTAEMSDISSIENSPVPKRSQSEQCVELLLSSEDRPDSCGIPAQRQATSVRSKSPASDPAHHEGIISDLEGMRIPGSAGTSGHLFSYPVLSSLTKGGANLLSSSYQRNQQHSSTTEPAPINGYSAATPGPLPSDSHDASLEPISQLVSTEQAVPNITRCSSLTVNIRNCFSLFVCLALLIQNRSIIFTNRLDFIGLSMLLNAQGGTHDLTKTLAVASGLLHEYQKYQKWSGQPDCWLDDDRGIDGQD